MKKCQTCTKEFAKNPRLSMGEFEKQKFCSRRCYWSQKKQEPWLNRGGGYNKGHKWSDEQKKRASEAFKGKRFSPKTEFKKGQFLGAKHPNWKGGSSLSDRLRASYKNREWIRQVFKRDNYTCQMCLVRGVVLEADHIVPFSYYLNLIRKEFPEKNWYSVALKYKPLWDISNGRALCTSCHKKTPTYASRARNFQMT